VDAVVIAGFTELSTFQRLATQSQAEQRDVLQNAFHTIGIDVCTAAVAAATSVLSAVSY
jgi:hypothetical protein